MGAVKNLVGRTFGLLTVIAQEPGKPLSKTTILCLCQCGGLKRTKPVRVTSGETKSCGCLRRQTLLMRNTTHGMSRSLTFTRYTGMKSRVRNGNLPTPPAKDACYKGVTICERWAKFEYFLEDMGECPSKDYTLERLDNAKGYEPSNCIWLHKKLQAQNTSRSVKVVYNGEEVCLSEACRRAGLRPDLVFDRVNTLGWPIDKALSTPPRKTY